MLFLVKILIVTGAVGTLRSCGWFRTMSRNLDMAVLASLKRMMHAAEESGYPPEIVPLVMLLMAFCYACVMSTTAAFVP